MLPVIVIPPASMRVLKALLKLAVRAAVAAFLIVAALLLVTAFADRKLPDLEPWHLSAPPGEFEAGDADPGFGLAEYRTIEDALFARLPEVAVEPGDARGISKYVRYVRGGSNNPSGYDPDWNRTFELVPEQIRGGVLLLHGLTDSPYSMRTVAETFREQGFYVLGLRLPGHGTVPAALTEVSWRDWMAATELGARHVTERIGDKPFFVGGYSNGGALALLYTLRAVVDGEGAVPHKVVLFCPAAAVTPLAIASNWHKLYSWIPYFRKSRWLSVQPEFDPYKYNSFPKNAGAQIAALAGAVQKDLTRAADRGLLDDLPPMLTFQSVVDATIHSSYVVDKLYDRLGDNGSELVMFDVNRYADLDGFYLRDNRSALDLLERPAGMRYRLTVVTNEEPGSLAAVARSRPARSAQVVVEPLALRWPEEVYSLAHVAIPFSPGDPVYGDGSGARLGEHVTLGNLSFRGERGVLSIPEADLMRLRHNPFHAYLIRRITGFIGDGAVPPTGEPLP